MSAIRARHDRIYKSGPDSVKLIPTKGTGLCAGVGLIEASAKTDPSFQVASKVRFLI